MTDEARRRVRKAMLARHATSPRVRGQYKRSIRAARLAQEQQRAAFADTQQHPAALPLVPEPRKRRRTGWILALGLLPILLIGAVGVYAANVYGHVQKAVSTIVVAPVVTGGNGNGNIPQPVSVVDTRPTNTPDSGGKIATLPPFTPAPTAPPYVAANWDQKSPVTFLLLGVDTREGDTDPSHSDTIILVYVDPTEKKVNLLSIPRDLKVTQASGGVAKMSDVYSNGEATKYHDPKGDGYGGVRLVADTVRQNFHIQIDYFAQVNFGGFRKIVDTIGGVTVDNPSTLKDDEYPTEDYQFTRVFFPAGPMHINGAEALEYARTRHGDGNNDFQRNDRQQQVILAIREQALKQNLFGKANQLIDSLADSIRTDFPPGTGYSQWLGFANFAKDLSNNNIRQFSLNDLLYDDTGRDGVYYAGVDWQKALDIARQFSPKENDTAIAAQARQGVNTNAKITVENGTRNGGLSNRWSQALVKVGYPKASGDGFVDAPATIKGNVPKSKVLYFDAANLDAAKAVAKAMGLTPDVVEVRLKRPPVEADARIFPADTDILVLLGDDAVEPSARPPTGPGTT